jgi:hypothetical protein
MHSTALPIGGEIDSNVNFQRSKIVDGPKAFHRRCSASISLTIKSTIFDVSSSNDLKRVTRIHCDPFNSMRQEYKQRGLRTGGEKYLNKTEFVCRKQRKSVLNATPIPSSEAVLFTHSGVAYKGKGSWTNASHSTESSGAVYRPSGKSTALTPRECTNTLQPEKLPSHLPKHKVQRFFCTKHSPSLDNVWVEHPSKMPEHSDLVAPWAKELPLECKGKRCYETGATRSQTWN